MRNTPRLKIALLLTLFLIFTGALVSSKWLETESAYAAATATPTIAPILPFNPLITGRGIPGAFIPNRVNAGSPIAVGTATAVEVIQGDPHRHDYTIVFDSTTTGTCVRCLPGDENNNAPFNEPTSSLGFEVCNTFPYYNEVTPAPRLDCISISGAVVLDTTDE